MGASEVMELVARIRPEGLDETVDGLEEAEESFEQTAETAEQSSDDLETFSERFEGAIGVAVGALAVGAGGLLSTVPIVGEAFAGIGAIIEAFGLQLDQLLRDLGVGGLTGRLFEAANTVASFGGTLGDLAGAIAGLSVAVAGFLASIQAYVTIINVATTGSATFTGVLGSIATAIGAVVGSISALTAGLAVLVAGVVAFAAAYLTNFRGVRDKTNAFVLDMIGFYQTLGQAFIDIVRINFQGAADLAVNIFNQIQNEIRTIIESILNFAASSLNKIPGVNIDANVDLGRVQTQANQSILQRVRTQRSNAAEGTAVEGFIDAVNTLSEAVTGDTVVQIDGREVGRSIEGYLGNNAADRGR